MVTYTNQEGLGNRDTILLRWGGTGVRIQDTETRNDGFYRSIIHIIYQYQEQICGCDVYTYEW